MKSLTVLVPVYNESRTLAELISQIDSMLSGVISECIFINDGSTDNSGEILAGALSNVSFKNQVITQANGGKSSAIRIAGWRSVHAGIQNAYKGFLSIVIPSCISFLHPLNLECL